MAHIANYARSVETGVPFVTGNATIKGPDGATLATPALNGTTGRWLYVANGQPGKTQQTYTAAGQVKIIEGDAYGQAGTVCEAEIERILGLFGSGVISGMVASAPGGMAVQVGLGDLLNLGVLHPIYTAENAAIAASDPSNPRIDRVVSRLTRTGTFTGKVILAVLTGTPAASPVAPALTQDANTWEIEVARVTVPASAGSIVGGNIDTTLRPTATGPLADNSVTNAKLADNSVGSAEIIDGSIQLVDLAAGLTLPFMSPGLINTYWVSGLGVVGGLIGGVTINPDTLYGIAIFIPRATTLTGLGVDRLGDTSVSATGRLGLYHAGSNGLPTTLHTDGGTVNLSTNGVKTITGLSVPLAAGWYWATVCCGSFTGTIVLEGINGVSLSGAQTRQILGSPAAGDRDSLISTQGVFVGTGSLPGTYPSPGLAAQGPNVWVQTAGS